jgi:hypothetical protein
MAAMKWSVEHRMRMIEDHEKTLEAIYLKKTPDFMEALILDHVEAAKQGVMKYVEESKHMADKS